MPIVPRQYIDTIIALDEEQKLFLINEPYPDSEGFEKATWYIATPLGNSTFDTVEQIGSSYDSYSEIRALANKWIETQKSC